MQGSFNPHWSTPLSRFQPPSLARFNSPQPLVFDSPRTPPGSPPPLPPPPPPPDSPPPPPSPPPGFSYRPSPLPGFALYPYQNQFFPRPVPDTLFPPFYSPAVQDSAAVPVSRYCASVSSIFLPPQATAEMRATRSRDHLFQPISLPNSTSRKGQTSGSGSRRKSTPASQPLASGVQGRTSPAPTKTPTSQPLASGSEVKMTPAPTKIPMSQPHGSGSQGRIIPVPKTPILQVDKRLKQVSSIHQFAPGQAESQKRNESTMEEGEIREISKDLTSSKKYELEASSVAVQDKQDQVIHDHLALEKGKEERQRDQTSNMEDASSAVEGGEINRGLAKNEKLDQSTHVDQTTPGESEAQKRSEHIVISDDDGDASSAAEGDIRDGNLKEFVSSTSIDPAASVLAAFGGEEMQVDETHQAQASPVQTKGKRPKDQMYPFEDGSSTSGGEIREKKLQKLSSSSKVGPEASVPESLCNFIKEKSHGCPDEEVSGSLSSSLLDWASTFGDGEVSSCDLQNGGEDGEMVKVGNYHMKEKYAMILLAIMKKHGDIGKDFKTSSIMWRSFALEGICEIFQGLRIPLKQLTSRTLKNYTSFVKEAAGMGMNVEWLEQQLREISETIDVIKECKVLRDAAEMNKEKFENLEKEFGLMVIKKKKLEDEIDEIKASLESGAIEIRNKRRAMNDIKVTCRNIPKRLLDGLF